MNCGIMRNEQSCDSMDEGIPSKQFAVQTPSVMLTTNQSPIDEAEAMPLNSQMTKVTLSQYDKELGDFEL